MNVVGFGFAGREGSLDQIGEENLRKNVGSMTLEEEKRKRRAIQLQVLMRETHKVATQTREERLAAYVCIHNNMLTCCVVLFWRFDRSWWVSLNANTNAHYKAKAKANVNVNVNVNANANANASASVALIVCRLTV